MNEVDAIYLTKAKKPTAAVIILPGRGGTKNIAYDYHAHSGLKNAVFVGATPFQRGNSSAKDYEWYPLPNGPNDQKAAIDGLPAAIAVVDQLVLSVQEKYDLTTDEIAIVGHSAGAVVVLESALNNVKPLGAYISHNGAILDPQKVSMCSWPFAPILLIHNKDDKVFDWVYRYQVTKSSLENCRYNIATVEKTFGGHRMSPCDISIAGTWLASKIPSLELEETKI